ncbi:MAG: hypothetical protein ABJN36_03270 [Cyclobacteriaceae bacterium]
MFDGADFPKPLSENVFDSWFEEGRLSKISYKYLLVVWDDFEGEYKPAYVETREKFSEYEIYNGATGRESLVAVYDLYSQSRISMEY